MIEYNKRLVEVDEVLKHLPKVHTQKIPINIIQAIKYNKDKNYIWNYDDTKALKDQKLNRDTIAILSYLNIEYMLSDEQKRYMEKLQEINEIEKRKEEYSKKNSYNYKKLFKKHNKIEQDENVSIVEYKEKFFTKIINKIKGLLKS